ncbi:sugar O-acyltransferase, sialic acid O-acetyltransferase NeuD family [Anaerocolumna jejuensis DSM 15929]|uniref:Sugar O-acyltransferase, sialic acid O-acetyltransferase NeuD family n=1 Tax=Anaerocolumna jejuensis DSM 15929 TaxID=1121322 RepID=A0A1M7B4M1_9FIRM|nr:acetyltransferase [Anaerocolumna jejuensis]SHL49854.1 sugar O-acyltransferase, sialic acid O-acetyltransferase NeuD family [Anaerocolumna jejuensis DSM 15929]
MNDKILLVGGGGHCKSVLDSLLIREQYSEIGIIDLKENIGKDILSVKIIGSDDDLKRLYYYGYHYAFVSLGSVGNPLKRVELFDLLQRIGFRIPNIIDPSAVISRNVTLENGIYIGKNAVINVGTSIKKGSIINTSSTLEHDCCIDKFVHVAPGAVLCGNVYVGENTHIGARSVVKQMVNIGNDTMIGMGSVVLKNIGNGITAYGNPCKEVDLI